MKMKDLKLGTILENGAEVYGILTLKGDKENPYYKIWSDKLNSLYFCYRRTQNIR